LTLRKDEQSGNETRFAPQPVATAALGGAPAQVTGSIFPEQVRLLYANSTVSQLIVLLLAVVLAVAQWTSIDHRVVATWFGVVATLACARIALTWRYQRSADDPDAAQRWCTAFLISVALSGLAWGAGGVLLLPEPQTDSGDVLVLLMLAGLTAGGASYLAPVRPAPYVYCIPLLLPLAVHFILDGEGGNVWLGVITALYLLAMLAVAHRLHENIRASLTLRDENRALVDNLTEAKDKLEVANAGLVAEIAERRGAEEIIGNSLSLLQATLEATADGLLVVDNAGRMVSFNQRFVKMWGIPPAVVEQRSDDAALAFVVDQLIDPDSFLDKVKTLYGQPEAESYDLVEFKDGKVFERFSMPQHIKGRPVGRVWSFRDISERKKAERDLRYVASHDSLTALPNRTLFEESLNKALARAKRHNTRLAVLFIDLDRFKNINDTLGHHVGDEMLCAVARRLVKSLREGDLVARLGGDEFIVLLENLPVAELAGKVGQKLLESIGKPFLIEQQELNITASIGISWFPGDAIDTTSLLKNADIAMYRAKEPGGNAVEFYSEQTNRHSLERLALEMNLRQALQRGELALHYQPKLELLTNRVVGVEALVRWTHPELGPIAPSAFIPLAEETGLIGAIGDWVLRQACMQNKRWRDAGLPPMRVAVNLSGRQFANDALHADILRILEETGLPSDGLEIELTESVVMGDADRAAEILRHLTGVGISLSIDDFGTGYSSLGYLKRFPIASLKIDRSFIRDVPHDLDSAAITEAVIAMAHSLRLRVVAEGVENEAQLSFLHELGCDEVQGYQIARPMPEAQLSEWLSRH